MSRKVFIAIFLTLAWVGSAAGQDAQRVAPKVPPTNPPATLQPPPLPPEAPSSQLVVAQLQGLVFVDTQQKIQPSSAVQGINVSATPLLNSPEFVAEVSKYLFKPLTLGQLNQICQFVVQYCRDHDRPVVDAIVPQQDVTTGTVQILVLQGHIGKIRTEGNRFFSSQMLLNNVRAKSGDEISQHQLLEDVDWIDRNPFIQSNVELERGQQFGQTDVVLQTQDTFPLRLYSGYENTGTVSTGQDRWLAGLNWGNAFGWGDQLNYQCTFGDNSDRFQAHSGSYVMPLPWRNVLTIFGNWSTSDVPTADGIDETGQDWQLSGRYEIPLPKIGVVSQSIVLGGDFKRSNTNADFGGFSVYSSYVDVVQFMLGYNVGDTDPFGSTNASLQAFISPGHIGGQDDRQAYDNARVGAYPQYVYGLASLDRTTNLPASFAWVSRFQGQLATSPLIGSEQLGVGGMDSVRGYLEREGNGDDGVIFSNEIHTPSASFFTIAGRKDQLYLLAFLDYGSAYDLDAQPGEPRKETFLGAGPGISYRLGPWLSADYAYGWRIAQGDPTVHATGRNHLRILASFTY